MPFALGLLAALAGSARAQAAPWHLYMGRLVPSDSADLPAASLFRRLLRHELEQETALRLAPSADSALGGKGCAGLSCELARAGDAGAIYLLTGAQRREPDGDAWEFSVHYARTGCRVQRSSIFVQKGEDALPKIRAVANRAASAATGRELPGMLAPRYAALRRLGRKDPLSGMLWNALPGGGVFYAGRPGWAGAYFAAEAGPGFLAARSLGNGDFDGAYPWIALAGVAKLAEIYHSLHFVRRWNAGHGLSLGPHGRGGLLLAWRKGF